MVDVGTSVNDVDVNTLATVFGVEVLVEGAEAQAVTVGDTGETPGSVLLDLGVRAQGVDFLISLDELDL